MIWDDGLVLAARDHCNDMKIVEDGFSYLGNDGKTLLERLSEYGRVEDGLYADYNFILDPHMSSHGDHVHADFAGECVHNVGALAQRPRLAVARHGDAL